MQHRRETRDKRHHRRSRSTPPVDGRGGGGSATSQAENGNREKVLERRAQHGTCARSEEADTERGNGRDGDRDTDRTKDAEGRDRDREERGWARDRDKRRAVSPLRGQNARESREPPLPLLFFSVLAPVLELRSVWGTVSVVRWRRYSHL